MLIRLAGATDYYYVTKAEIVDDEEWGAFLERSEEWTARVAEYFDMYRTE